MRDQPVEEAVWATGVVALGLCALDLAVEVAGGLLVDVVLVVVVVEVGWVGVSKSDTNELHARSALIRFLSCMESLRFSLSLMPDMSAFAVFWKGVVWCSDEL